jgi:hypothetical protein
VNQYPEQVNQQVNQQVNHHPKQVNEYLKQLNQQMNKSSVTFQPTTSAEQVVVCITKGKVAAKYNPSGRLLGFRV